MTANIILPENGTYWTQLRQDNFTAIDFGDASLPLIDLIKCLLVPDPQKRPTASDILLHPIVQNVLK